MPLVFRDLRISGLPGCASPTYTPSDDSNIWKFHTHTLVHVSYGYSNLQSDTDIGEKARGENAFEVQDAFEVQITLAIPCIASYSRHSTCTVWNYFMSPMKYDPPL
jgi:hypothetical protein